MKAIQIEDGKLVWAEVEEEQRAGVGEVRIRVAATAINRADLVQRTEDPTDRRAKVLSLTEEGRALANSIEDELIRLCRDVFGDIDPADLEATLRVFKAFAKASPMGPELSS